MYTVRSEPNIAGILMSFWSFNQLMQIPLYYLASFPAEDYDLIRTYCNVWSWNGEVRA